MTSAGTSITRRSLLETAGLGGLALLSTPALAQRVIELVARFNQFERI